MTCSEGDRGEGGWSPQLRRTHAQALPTHGCQMMVRLPVSLLVPTCLLIVHLQGDAALDQLPEVAQSSLPVARHIERNTVNALSVHASCVCVCACRDSWVPRSLFYFNLPCEVLGACFHGLLQRGDLHIHTYVRTHNVEIPT